MGEETDRKKPTAVTAPPAVRSGTDGVGSRTSHSRHLHGHSYLRSQYIT